MTKAATTSKTAKGESGGDSASRLIDAKIRKLDDWRGEALASVRKAILDADKEIIEEWKWMGSPVWSRDGIIAVGNAHKEKVKLTFAHGASLPDPDKLFNAGLEGKVWRAIDVFEGDKVNARALKNLVRAAIVQSRKAKKKTSAKKAPAKKTRCGCANESRQKHKGMMSAKEATGAEPKAKRTSRPVVPAKAGTHP